MAISEPDLAIRPAAYRLSGLELTTSLVLGSDPAMPLLDYRDEHRTPRLALEDILLSALQKPPCLVAFSGGRDSSGVLALAVHVARREGLGEPVPVTNRFPGDEKSTESEWQDLVVRHLKIGDWERLTYTDELDIIGPIAAPELKRWGPFFPFNGHFLIPAMDRAAGGSLLTGVGGDEIFQLSARNRLGAALMRREPLRRHHIKTALTAVLPLSLRWRTALRDAPSLPWLRRLADDEYRRRISVDEAAQPIWNAADLEDWWCDRGRIALETTLSAFASERRVDIVHPLQHHDFLAATAARHPRVAWLRRAQAMQALFGDVLPAELIMRRSKAGFAQPFVSTYSREFIADWDGTGVDTSIVDPDRLRETWQEPVVDGRSYSLLQSAWLACEGETVQTPEHVPTPVPAHESALPDPDIGVTVKEFSAGGR